MPVGIKTYPEPYCPICGARMRLRRPKAHHTWKAFWGCSEYPACTGTRDIDPETGEPEYYEREFTDDYP